jgi:hypothetical protein
VIAKERKELQHGQIEEFTNLEVPPYSQLVVGIDLPYWHPLMVGSDSGQLSICKTCTRGREGAADACIVGVGCACFPRIVRDLYDPDTIYFSTKIGYRWTYFVIIL